MATQRPKVDEVSRVATSRIKVGLIWIEIARLEALKKSVVEANRVR
jgi:hypothetical protein